MSAESDTYPSAPRKREIPKGVAGSRRSEVSRVTINLRLLLRVSNLLAATARTHNVHSTAVECPRVSPPTARAKSTKGQSTTKMTSLR